MKALIGALLIIISSCASPMRVEVIGKVPETKISSFVLLNENDFSSLVRRALVRNGIKVKAFSAIYDVTEKSEDLDVSYEKAEAQFGIRHQGRLSGNNPCLTNGNAFHFSEYEFEVIDLRTNETILFVSKGGWTEWCTGAPTIDTTDLFGDLSKELAKVLLRSDN
jgi:hypothetical protein